MPIPPCEAAGLPAEALAAAPSMVTVAGIRTELIERGTGQPLLFLHPGIGIDPTAEVLDRLAAGARLIAPSHPGFGASEAPKHMTTVDDLAYFYLDLMDALDLRDTTVVGVSFGAWIAAEIAIKSTARISRLVMSDAVGIKVGDRETRDIVDIFALTDPQLDELTYCDPKFPARDYKAMPAAAVTAIARNREALGRYGWQPYMHDPKLKGRLHRIQVPTLFLWGTHDRIVTESYGRAYCAKIAGARFELIDKAGHFPHLEQPKAFADRVLAFAG